MFHSVPPHTPPAIIQQVAPENTTQTTGIPFQIANTPTLQTTDTVASRSTPTLPETLLPEYSDSNLPILPERIEQLSAAQLGQPISVSLSDNQQGQLDFSNTNTPTNRNPLNSDLTLYPDNGDDLTFSIQSPSDNSNITSTPDTQLSATNSDASTPPENPATDEPESLPLPTDQSPIAQVPDGFSTFLVGIKVNNRNVVTSILVRGQDDGTQAIDFDQWLLPYDAVVQALKLNTKLLPDNQIELRSPSQVVRIQPNQLKTDPELGLVFSVADLRTLFGVEIEFDILDYAVAIQAPWLNQQPRTGRREQIVQTEGLPRIAASGFSLSAIEQRLDASGTGTRSPNYTGNVSAVGSIFGGSWYIRANQPQLFSADTWSLAEARFQRQTDAADYIVGSQPTFWRSQSGGDYWGFTTIQRHGFVPQLQLYGGSDPRQRLNSAEMGRTISGEAEPGTLVRLVEGFSDQPISEVLVDSSGVYRFEDIEFNSQSINNYRVLLYPQGRLTETPEIRSATFSNLPGQIPTGSSVYVVSGGWRRQLSGLEQGLLGNFSDFQGGVMGRWGVSNSLTLGAGAVYDESLRGVGELFFQPEGFPLKAAVSVLSGTEDSDWDINADVLFEPSRNFTARFTSDRFATRLNAYWQLFPGFTLLGGTSSNDATEVGVQLAFSGKNAFTFARATFDTKSRFRWNFIQRLNQFQLRSLGNEISTQSELSYNFSKNFSTGHALVLGYDTQSQNDENLASLTWRYTSEQKSIDGSPLWDAQLGYGVGSRGSGIVAAVGTSILPGLRVQARYQGVSVSSDESAFSLNLVSGLNLQQGLSPGDRRADYLRTQGGLLIQPFFDRNQNGKHDPGEKHYTDPDLLMVNNQPTGSLRAEIQSDRILMHLPPGIYRLDLDPAGFPFDWQAVEDAYAVDVVAGSYTPVLVPLVQSYTVSGIVTDDQGQPISGARVEAIPSKSGERSFSVTNDAGVYYLERLQQGSYSLQINGQSAFPNVIELQSNSETFQELNLVCLRKS
ncbi:MULTISPECIES: carboxypeptidase regulatory-like domain-containing protein [unclassified Coleofasciculus]|uniref:carboxypeptidase regulatory-like domain-containing protein n=1 Tax=unclassified Coleofasciculus TaxID=2692782 RepID=UPI0018824C78|nr:MULTISPECIES: carboxypeptidase regulatory-like domain-containing protein [unclassified Coleofasciculus]MBE9126964.1 carboxypeptidase regulatory-like domain-containing protein [Coleofasciculus sp. LEGE 07081]MBE9150271.1 carboxypeptidase regulatory-like domain-containing protein [Coleofasciculus sp. LEGE 07092]